MKGLIIFFLFAISCISAFAQDKINNTSYVSSAGEKILRLEMVLPVSRKEAWNYFTKDEKMKWMAPVIHIELKTGGHIRTNYDPKKPLSDPSSIQLDIINTWSKNF